MALCGLERAIMMKFVLALLIFDIVCFHNAECQKPGIQMRITKKGFDYGMQTAMTRVRHEITKMRMDQHGYNGKVEYWLSNFRVYNVGFPNTVLRPISDVGVEANLRGISLSGGGNLRYCYHTGVFGVKVCGNVGFSINLNGVQTYIQVVFGKDGSGRPTIGLRQCWSVIGSVNVNFHGGGILGWIMNLFRGHIGNIAKGMLRPFICQQIRAQVISNSAASLRGFPVTQKIDKTVALDYRLVAQPKYTYDYMDVFLKGQFKCLSKPSPSHLVPNTFPVNGDHAKMLYFWVSDYALNTAGESYQNSGLLSLTIESWKAKIPDSRLADILQLKTFIKMFPDLSKLGHCPLAIYARSYIAPSMSIKSDGVHAKVSVEVDLKMKNGDKVTQLFGCNVDVSAVIQPEVSGSSLVGTFLVPAESCRVELFQHNFSGIKDTYTQSSPALHRNDDMSSLRVSPGCCVTLFEHGNYGGKSRTICKDTSFKDLGEEWNDMVSSIKISSPDPKDFDFKITMTSSFTGQIDLTPPPEFQEVIMKIIAGAVNPALQKGFPLPKTREISFRSTNLKLYDGAIRVGTDLLLKA